MSVRIDTDDLTAAAAALRESSAPGRAIETFVRMLGPEALRAVKARARRHRRTGAFEAGITLSESGAGDDARATVSIGGGHGPVVVTGSVPHTIRARHGRPLPLAGGPRPFAFSVKHPGTKADPILDLALGDLGGSIDAGLSRAGDVLGDVLADEIKRRI